MNILIDFDHTLYDPDNLTKDMLDALAKYIEKKSNKNYNEILSNLKNKFSRGENKIYDIYELIEYFSKENRYNYDVKEATKAVNDVIANGSKYVFDESIPFLKSLKKKGHKIYILSYNEKKVYYQTVKIAGSGLLEYVDGVITTTVCKGEMPFDFSKCIFIDDKPKDLISIYNKKPLGIFRIKHPRQKYSSEELNLRV